MTESETVKQEPDQTNPPAVEGDWEELNNKLVLKTKEAEENYAQTLRALADFDNYKKRVIREKLDLSRAMTSAVLLEIFPVVDSLERTLDASQKAEGAGEQILKGVELTLKQVQKSFEKLGVTPQECLGKVFDPYCHEALGHVETDQYAPDTVAEEVQKGYLLDGKVIRPAIVKVAKTKENTGSQNEKI